MSVFTELIKESGVNPYDIYVFFDDTVNSPPAPWNLPQIDLLDVWGSVDLRTMFGLISGGDTPTTYSRRMADAIRELTGPSLLGFDEEPVQVDFTATRRIIEDLRVPVDAEVVEYVD